MRSYILLLVAATLVAVHAAPISVKPEAGVVKPNRELPMPCKYNRFEKQWECPLAPETEVEAGTVKPNRELPMPCKYNRFTKEWECPLAPEVESYAASVEPEVAHVAPNGRECRKVGQTWICSGEK
ncbi:hypothetical protein BGZ95_003682 [Linnemannia exigua]|uniref:Uncharacterized protein n=1 Tax=Linnemannia exigua TaxID=604196 RepID=A0AAD4D4E6_9FUNG|nr:hypothetical protein BGZ95_003682 [Linnemannia exigua]